VGFVTFRAIMIAAAVLGGLAAGLLPGAPASAAERTGSLPAAARPADSLVTATDIRVGGDDKQTRLVVDLTGKVDLVPFTLADPYRVVIDLPQVAFRLPPKAGEQGRGLIKAFRYGLIMQGGSRIVLDLKGPARIEKAFAIDAADGLPARLVLDLVPTDRASFLRTIAQEDRSGRTANAKAAESSPKALPDKASSDPRPLIVLDPGHGGIDNGTKASSGEMEKDLVLQFAQLLRGRLERSGKYRIAMTRSDDTFIPLAERVHFARQQGASLLVSIHCDAVPKGEGIAEGATVYTLSENASDSEAARLAEAENRADAIAGVDLTAEPDDIAGILVDLAQRETKAYSTQFARTLVSDLKSTAKLHKHPIKSAGFKVLKAPDVPSVLVELGYMSTKDDLKQLTSPAWQDKTAGAVAQAVDTFFAPRLAGAAPKGN